MVSRKTSQNPQYNLVVDSLQQQKTTSASNQVIQEQEYEATVGTQSLKLKNVAWSFSHFHLPS